MSTIAKEYPDFAYKMGLTSPSEPSKAVNSGKRKFGRKKTQQRLALQEEIGHEDREIRQVFLVSYMLPIGPADSRYIKEVARDVIFDVFSLKQDDDIVSHEPPSVTTLVTSQPDPEDLKIDMIGEISSSWNKRLMKILTERLLDASCQKNLPQRTNQYLTQLIEGRITRLRTNWRSLQPKRDKFGNLENPEAVEKRVFERTQLIRKEGRKRERRVRVSRLFFLV
ncbi:MAG TPA: hypothetical protein VGO47_11680 [Chlamydiales bacterium]|nr:hypothetical protein [Chlamydiales bacterium]